MLSMRKRIVTAVLAVAMLATSLCAGGCSLFKAGLPETPLQKAEKGEELTSAELAALTPEEREKYGYTSGGKKEGQDGGEQLVMPEYPIRAPKEISILYPDGQNWLITYEYDLTGGVATRSESEAAMDAVHATEYRFEGELLRESSGFFGAAAYEYKDGLLQNAAWMPRDGSTAEASFLRNSAGKTGGFDLTCEGQTEHIGCELVAGLVSTIDLEWAGERIFFSYKTAGSRVDAYSVTLQKYGDILWKADVALTYEDGLLTERKITVDWEKPGAETVTFAPAAGETVVRYTYAADAPSYFAQAAPELGFMDPELRLHLPIDGEWWLL